MGYRPGLEMWEESEEVRCSHLLYEDLKNERTDVPKWAFYVFLQQNYLHLRGKSKAGNIGYRLKYIPK